MRQQDIIQWPKPLYVLRFVSLQKALARYRLISACVLCESR